MSKTRRKLEASSWLAVVRAYQECHRRYARLMDAFGLTTPQFDALNAIARLGAAATPKAIAAELVVTRGNVTGVLKRLDDAKLIETRDNETDRRSFTCALTPAGVDLLDNARRAASTFIRKQLAPFDEAELERTEAQMRKMHEHLSTIDPLAIADSVAAASNPAKRG